MERIISKTISAFIVAAIMISAAPLNTYAVNNAELKDSGINYAETVETIGNPGIGYTSTVWSYCSPGKTNVYNPTGDIMLFFIDIGGFSSGSNGVKNDDGTYTDGTDYDFDQTFLDAWAETLNNCRSNGCMAALRFRYDSTGKDNPEPASFDQVLRHIQQLKDSGIFEEYSDVIAFVECGFVGKWGEQHGGKYTSVQHKVQLLEALLQAVPAPIPVTVRTPDIFAEWAGIARKDLNNRELIDSLTESKYTSEIQKNKSRIGLYNDGYMGSDSDLGTYSNREIETAWLADQTMTSYYGGEFSGNIDFAKKYDTYLPENAIPEMYKTHLSYINGNIFQLYKDYTFSESYDVSNVDNSAYYGQTVFSFIRDHLGYRYVLRDSNITPETRQGGSVQVNFSVENTGFANQIPAAQSYILIEKDGKFAYAEADIDSRNWLSCTKSEETVSFKLPDSIEEGEWNAYLKLSMGTPAAVTNMTGRSIRFTNDNIWNSSLGANYIGSFTVGEAESRGTDNSLTVSENSDDPTTQFYNVGKKTVVDGIISSSEEWTEEMIAGSNDSGYKIYAKADDQYLYLMSNIPQDAAAPVYNLQLYDETGERYWLYYASNGFIYFNHDSYNGCQCKWGDDMVEFRIPFEVMGLKPNSEISNLRIFMQDSGNDWKLMSDVTIPKCTVPADFSVLTSETNYRMNVGDNLEYTVIAELESGEPKYIWKRNGELLDGINGASIRLDDLTAANSGKYTVTIVSAGGIEKEVVAFNLEVVSETGDYLAGDANCDGKVEIADATLILQYLTNKDEYALTGQGLINADVIGNADGVTAQDALTIQQVDAGIYKLSDLPLKN